MAVVDYFLRIDQIDGESQDAKHPKAIELLSWSWSEQNAATHSGHGLGSGKVSVNEFMFTSRTSSATPWLLRACADGRAIKHVRLFCRKAGKDQQEYLSIEFTDCLISAFKIGGDSNDVIPADQCRLAFNRIVLDYRAQLANGTLGPVQRAGWDVSINKPL
jgi:type VI secretion system secreted protein Hcp